MPSEGDAQRKSFAQLMTRLKRAMLIEGEAERKRCSVKDELKKGDSH